MNRVAIFLGGLVVLFTGAFALGNVFGDQEKTAQHGPATTEAEHAAAGQGEEIGGSHGEAAHGPQTTDPHDLKLALANAPRAGQGGNLAFRILDAGGEPVTKFEVEHTKQVHLILVSKDLVHFQHVHPKVDGEGVWSAPVDFTDPGDYRVIADVRHDGRKLALDADLAVDGAPMAVGRPAAEADFVEQELRAGQPTTLRFEAPPTEEYLGAAGHLVILSEKDLEYLHVHPREDELAFEAAFPEPGRYVMFLEYRRGGKVSHARFPVTVA